ncbi:MAG TPA: bifunctional 5,10-methylene-tetrahydrofolate dehydrogenase/5,10-methylene-tetrahydrofolate cyclohydrolase [Lachnospiraceae bacterium]|nr:bifunctional 5,10-methylene-tetrahydrofolate dehydrogenase/5,10-methylene-tetrahydrofolate cyclohydrolase [Lachnospiraceae bacterium]
MGIIMKGTEVARAMKEQLKQETEQLRAQGVFPQLTIMRVGARPDDLAYERGARKRMELVGIECNVVELPEQISRQELEEAVRKVNGDPKVHGILLFRPLPPHLNEEAVIHLVDPAKDVDGMNPENIAKVFSGDDSGFAPCTPQAVIRMLEYYGIELQGKRVTVIGRSMVVGKPLSMLLLKKHATVTICHTRTVDLKETCRNAEILIAAAGSARMVTEEMAGTGAVVVDVGINVDPSGQLCGDVDFDAVEKKASYVSPVPGGVGSVTSSVLAEHVIKAAKMAAGKRA